MSKSLAISPIDSGLEMDTSSLFSSDETASVSAKTEESKESESKGMYTFILSHAPHALRNFKKRE